VKILLVEDHPAMSEIVADYLRHRGFAIDVVRRADEALAASRVTRYDAVILDLGLPDADGMHVLNELRRRSAAKIPAIIVSARDGLEDRVDGLNSGADDYIVKPFELTELEARLRAVLRRPGPRLHAIYHYGDLDFDPSRQSAAAGNRALDLTRLEALALQELVRAAGQAVVKDTLEDRLYGFNDDVSMNALEAVISRLRRRLAAAGSAVSIESLRGIGYRLRMGGPA
jgi:two-component system, OmpR family, response regulator QseB